MNFASNLNNLQHNIQISVQNFYTQDVQQDERLNVTHLAAIENLENTTVYACGPSGFVQTAEELFGHAQCFKVKHLV
jgi:ferredoxin-NADP reductase